MATPAPAKETPSLETLIQQLAASVREKLAPNTTLISAWGVALLSPNFRRVLDPIIQSQPTAQTLSTLCDITLETLNQLAKGTYQ